MKIDYFYFDMAPTKAPLTSSSVHPTIYRVYSFVIGCFLDSFARDFPPSQPSAAAYKQ